MSLITRCPACATTFKVVADQLKVSQGWVRCGYCSDVFDASLHLQPVPAPGLPDPPTDLPLPNAIGSPAAAAAAEPLGLLLQRMPSDEGRPNDFDSAKWKTKQQGSAQNAPSVLHQNENSEGFPEDPVKPVADEAPSELVVSFMRDAHRKAFWRKPAVRLALGVSSVLLSVLLVLQVTIQQRDKIATLQPGLKPLLQGLCGYLECQVGPLRQIEAVVIESSSFKKIRADTFRLSFSLKNAGPLPVAMPSLEVTLTDPQELAVLRRVLTPAELGASSPRLLAGTDFVGLVDLQLTDANEFAFAAAPASAPLTVVADPGSFRVAGYRVLAFYP